MYTAPDVTGINDDDLPVQIHIGFDYSILKYDIHDITSLIALVVYRGIWTKTLGGGVKKIEKCLLTFFFLHMNTVKNPVLIRHAYLLQTCAARTCRNHTHTCQNNNSA
jgi:hypothetical protein